MPSCFSCSYNTSFFCHILSQSFCVFTAIQSEWVQPRVCVLDVTIERGIIPGHTDWVLADVVPEFRRVVAESVVRQSRLVVVVLSLEEERYRHIALGIQPRLSLLEDLAVHVQATIPHFLALLVIRLRGRAELVADDAVCLAILDESKRYEALFFEELSPEVKLVVLPAIVLPFPAGVPLVQRHIVVPYPMGVFTGEFAETTPQGIKTINLL